MLRSSRCPVRLPTILVAAGEPRAAPQTLDRAMRRASGPYCQYEHCRDFVQTVHDARLCPRPLVANLKFFLPPPLVTSAMSVFPRVTNFSEGFCPLRRIKEHGVRTIAPRNRKKVMKNSNRLLIAVAALALFASTAQIKAQSQPVGDDGLAASPKVRQMLNERYVKAAAVQGVTISRIVPQTTAAASPKAQQMLDERAPASVVQVAPQTAGYRQTGSEGIAASPKVRATLDEHQQTVEIAPLK